MQDKNKTLLRQFLPTKSFELSWDHSRTELAAISSDFDLRTARDSEVYDLYMCFQ